MTNRSDSTPLSPRDYLILLALTAGERHGYGLIGEIDQLSDGTVRVDPANLYRALKRMVRDGLVVDLGRLAEPGQDDDERRRFYRLSPAGLRVVRAEATRLDRLAVIARERALVPESEP